MGQFFQWILLSVLVTSFTPAQAYVPRIQTIVQKMSKNNGRRVYRVVREVTFESQNNRIQAREIWHIKNGDLMKLTVTSADADNPWTFEIAYGGKKRRTISSTKNVKQYAKSEEFFEPLFHDRYSKSLIKRLAQYRFIPSWAKDIPAPDYQEGQTKMTEEPFVRLEPVAGSVNYAIGANKNNAGDQWQTTLYVEQDSFLIKKGRLRSNAEFTNEDFQTFPGGLRLPRLQTITWDDRVARIRLINAEPIRAGKKTFALNKATAANLPKDPMIKEFYSRFR